MILASFIENMSIYGNTILVSFALAVSCSILSVFIVLRRMAMISEAVAHSGIGGIAIALILGYYINMFNDPILIHVVTAIFCVTTALVIGYVAKGKHVSEDSAIGIFLVASVGFGIFLLNVRRYLPKPILPAGTTRPPQPANIESILFGDILSVTSTEVALAVGAMVIVVLVVLAFYNEFVYTSLDMEMARINGVRTNLINTLLLCMIALVIVVGSRMAGALLITAIMVIPGATACMLSRKFNGVLLASLIVGIFGTTGGVFAAINPPFNRFVSGPILVLALFLIFGAVWVFRKVFRPQTEALPGAAAPGLIASHDHNHAH